MSGLLALAFGAGLLAPVNPCGFGLLPAVLTATVGGIDNPDKPGSTAAGTQARLAAGLRAGLALAVGFTATFTVIGLLLTVGVRSVITLVPWGAAALGVVLTLIGLSMLAGWQSALRLPGRHPDPTEVTSTHPLDELVHLSGVEAQVGQLVATPARDEDPTRIVDPDLLHLGVVEERLQRAEARHPGHELADHHVVVGDGSDGPGQAELVVVADDVLGDAAYDEGLALRVDPLTAQPLAHLPVEPLHQLAVGVRAGSDNRTVDG